MNGVIRKWRSEDAADLAAVLNNQKILDNLRDGIPYPYTERDAKEFIMAMQAADPEKVFAFAVISHDRVIGSIAAYRQENIHFRTAELGYYIGEAYWGQGICTEAVRQVCRFLFEHTDIIRIFAEPFAYNTASCRVLEKSGFQFEGRLRRNAVKNGAVLDMNLFALLKE